MQDKNGGGREKAKAKTKEKSETGEANPGTSAGASVEINDRGLPSTEEDDS